VPLNRMRDLLATLVELDRVTKKNGFIEADFR
jgi:2-dehydro-3-deoxyphosphooctonate aldolase (KDO 8-P synthase)